MGFGLNWVIDKITFPSPPSSYSLTSHPELFFVRSPQSRPSYPGVPCMLYAIPSGAPVLLVHAHSNGCDIGDMRQTLQNISESLRVHVLSFEYPGYGLHVGTPSMRSIDEAAMAVADYLRQELKVNMSQVVWYGRSIGTGPALRMVHHISKELGQQPGGVVLQCGYANFQEVAGHLFGRMAKRLVSPLWPNEAMVKDLSCPVLLIHGRNDTMIPIEQSEKLWSAVQAKEHSHFHACDCGHNDFNFRRCTLRPIYDFLLGVISAANFPTSNFNMEVPATSRPYVHHIGPLRSKIPVYSFRRPELEEWLRQLLQRSRGGGAAEEAPATPLVPSGGPPADPSGQLRPGQRVGVQGLRQEEPGYADNGKQGLLLTFDDLEKRWWLRLDAGNSLLLKAENILLLGGATGSGGGVADGASKVVPEGAEANKVAEQPSDGRRNSNQSSAAVHAAPTATAGAAADAQAGTQEPAGSKRKGAKKGKANADQPPIPDFSQMPQLEDVAAALLDPEGMIRTCAIRVAAFLDRVQRQLDRIADLEKKPLDEIVDLVEAEFWASDPLLCLWEEVNAETGSRVRMRLGPFSVDSSGERTYDFGLGTGNTVEPAALLRVPVWLFCPSPAHFRCLAEWSLLHSQRLARNLPLGGQASNNTSCCRVPSVTGRRKSSGKGRAHPSRGTLATSLAAHFVHWVEKTADVKAMFARFAALYSQPEEMLKKPPSAAASVASGGAPPLAPKELSDFPPSSANSSCEEDIRVCTGAAATGFFPCSPVHFSSSSRVMLREGIGGLSSKMAELQTRVWGAAASGNEGNLCDFKRTAELLATNSEATEPFGDAERYLDWGAARLLLHYERLLWGASDTGDIPFGASEDTWGDPLRPDVLAAGRGLNKAIKAFAQAEHKERRESQQVGSRHMPRPAPQLSSSFSAGSTSAVGSNQIGDDEAQHPGAAGHAGV